MKTFFSRGLSGLLLFFCVQCCTAQTLADSTKVNRLLDLADKSFVKNDSAAAKKYWAEALTLHPWSCRARNGMMMLQGSVLCNCDEKSKAYEYQLEQAEKQYAAKKYAAAERLYREADALQPSTKLQRKIQRCHAKISSS